MSPPRRTLRLFLLLGRDPHGTSSPKSSPAEETYSRTTPTVVSLRAEQQLQYNSNNNINNSNNNSNYSITCLSFTCGGGGPTDFCPFQPQTQLAGADFYQAPMRSLAAWWASTLERSVRSKSEPSHSSSRGAPEVPEPQLLEELNISPDKILGKKSFVPPDRHVYYAL